MNQSQTKDKAFIEEADHLKKTLALVKITQAEIKESLETLGKETREKLLKLRENAENNAMDFFMALEEINQQHQALNLKDRFQQIEELESSMREPYFARIDLDKVEESDEKTLYIGKFGLTYNNKPIIVDWRAKIASIYYRYRYPQRNVVYETPEGKKVRDLTLKRTFEIEEGELIKYYNNDIQLDEKDIITGKIEGRTGGVLEDIVETIQEAQLDIIEADPRSTCIVQGCVGSGKSTVAIHKLSHIFFNYPNLVKPQNAILVTKSHVLASYLATLFPKLGIFDIQYKTISDLIYNYMFRSKMPVLLNPNLETDETQLGLNTLKTLRNAIKELHEATIQEIQDVFDSNEEFAPFASYKYDYDIAPMENIETLRETLREELANEKERLKANPKSDRAWLHHMNIKNLAKMLTLLTKARVRITHKLEKTYKGLGIPKKGDLNYTQAIIYTYLHIKTLGLDRKAGRVFQYCVIDEGQDLTPMEYALLNEFVLHQRFTILGDLNQGYTGTGLNAWEDLRDILRIKRISFFTLDTNYRSTEPIIRFANQILKPYTNKYLPKSIQRKGADPVITTAKTTKELLEIVKRDLEKDAEEYGKSIGIITFDENTFGNIRALIEQLPIEEERKIVLERDTKVEYKPKGIYLTKFETCKGLEFGKVYLVNKNPVINTSFDEAKKSFVGVTRAMDDLAIYYTEN